MDIPEAVIKVFEENGFDPKYIRFYKENYLGKLYSFDFKGEPTGLPWYIAYKDGKAKVISYKDYPEVLYL